MLNNADTIRAIRKRMGLTQTQLAERMGYKLKAWQVKEHHNPEKARRLMDGEFQYLLLIADEHPTLTLIPKEKPAE